MMRSTVLSSALVFSLAACGGGGGSSPATPLPTVTTPPPVITSVTASGVITGFSSVFVNGARYEIENDTIVAIEGEVETSGDDGALRVGMKVSIRARESEGERVAQRIEYDEDLKGPAMNITVDVSNSALGSFSVVMQSVFVDANTIFDDDVGDNNADGTIDIRDLELANGQVVVEVSGLLMSDGFLATRIDRVNSAVGVPGVADDELEVKGFVDVVAADGSSFTINGATFVVLEGAGGTIFDDGLVADESLVGLFVEVKADQNSGGDYIAVSVEREDEFRDDNDDGRIDDEDRNGRFEVEGILVSVDTSITPHVLIIGSVTLKVTDASSLVGREGTLLEVKGSFDDNGVLSISRAQLEVENTIRIEDRVAEVSDATITTRLGVVVRPTGSSRVRDNVNRVQGDHLTPQTFLERLQPNDYIEARGFVTGDNVISWRRVEREDEEDQECRLRGPVESIEGNANDFSFVIQGVTIDVSQIVDANDFEGVNEQTLGRQAFFDQLDVADVVQAKSDEDGLGCEVGRLTAREVEYEVDDALVGTAPAQQGNGGIVREVTGTPSNVTGNSFDLADLNIAVVGNTLIDDSILEAALGREIDGDDLPFDQIPAGVTLADLLPGTFTITVDVDENNVAIQIEDL